MAFFQKKLFSFQIDKYFDRNTFEKYINNIWIFFSGGEEKIIVSVMGTHLLLIF